MNPEVQQVGMWVLVAIALLPAVNTLRDWFGGDKRAKRDVKIEDECLPRAEFAAHVIVNREAHQQIHDRIEGVKGEIHGMELRLNHASEERAKLTHDRVNAVLEAVSELRGEMKGLSKCQGE